MSIRDSDVQRVREATDLVALIGRRVSLRRVGSRHVGLCPFHTEKTPSFSVSAADGFYYCFGCKASGDAITFVRETEQLDFVDAVEQLAAAASIALTYDSPGVQRANRRRRELLDLLERAARFYHELLMSGAEASKARAYLRSRGYDRHVVTKWRLGYAPALWDALCAHLGASADQLAAAGLAYVQGGRGARSTADATGTEQTDLGQQGTGQQGTGRAGETVAASDFFRDRIMFPICDAGGRVVSFAGRTLPRPDEPALPGPKYKNTVGTAVYDKSSVLYGLHAAKQAGRTAERMVVCEGYTDVIGCDLVGISEAVATCGTAFTAQHAELLSRTAKHIVLAFDADAAGRTATERVHQWERTYGLSVSVARLPPGADPGDLAATDPPALRKALDDAQPLYAFRAERLLERAELDSPAGRDHAAEQAAEVLAMYPPDVLLDDDLAPIAGRIPMDVGPFRDRVDAARQRLDQRAAAQHRRSSARSYGTDDAGYPEDAYPQDEMYSDDGPFDDYRDDAYAGDGWLPGDEGMFHEDDRSAAAPVAGAMRRRAAGRRRDDARRQAERDAELLAAACAEGRAVELIVPALYATPEARRAFAQMRADPHWRRRAAAAGAPGPTQQAGSESSEEDMAGGDPAAAMLAVAAAAGADMSAEESNDRVAMAMLRFVRETKDRVSAGEDVTWLELDSGLSADDSLKERHERLRWLGARETELLDLDRRIAAVQELRDRLCAVEATAPQEASQSEQAGQSDAAVAGIPAADADEQPLLADRNPPALEPS